MNTAVHLAFPGTCDEAFAFYETVFGTRRVMTTYYRDAPPPMKCPAEIGGLVMHTSMPLGSITLMAADAPPDRRKPDGHFSAFDISLDDPDESKVKSLFAALSEGGSVTMPLQATFWTPLFGMCTDKFGVPWMLSVPGPQPA